MQSPGTVYTFAVDGKAPLPAFVKYQTEGLLAGVKYDPKDVPEGTALYVSRLRAVPSACRASTRAAMSETSAMSRRRSIENLKDFVFKGPFRDQGMPDFTGKLKEEDVPKMQAFIQGTADAIRPKVAIELAISRLARRGRSHRQMRSG